MATKTKAPKAAASTRFQSVPDPTLWPGANARLLSAGAGLPTQPLDRLANFDDTEFERFTLEWAHDYLAKKIAGVDQIQQRGGAGDKGRDIVVWLDPSSVKPRRWHLYQCKHYAAKLSASDATTEIGKVLYNTLNGTYTSPEEYWFVTHKGVTGPLQDLLDDPAKLRSHILANWAKDCEKQITSTEKIPLSDALKAHIAQFDFSIFQAKQPLELIDEHAQTKYHMLVFGAPLVKRPPAPQPPSSVAAEETVYVTQLFAAIAEALGVSVTKLQDFVTNPEMANLFDRSRITFYSAEGLKELARDQMADTQYFNTLLDDFYNGLFHTFSPKGQKGLNRLRETIKAAQTLQLGAHALEPHATPLDREGVCHHLANANRIEWCEK